MEVETGTNVADTALSEVVASQGIEGPSEAELRGETTEVKTEEEKPKDEKTEDKKTEDVKTEDVKTETDEAKKDDSKTTEELPASSEPKVKEAPKGFVPLKAMHDARDENRYLKGQIQVLKEQQAKLAEVKAAPEAPKMDDFEVLTDEQFEVLAEDEPAQAAIYLRKLGIHEANVRATADEEKNQAEFEKSYDNIINTSVAEIEKVAPGIFDEDSGVQNELMEFAEGFGFTEDMYYLTNPGTKIILSGETEPLLLGEQSASILGMLVNAKAKMTPPDTTEIEAKLRTEITAELMKKFKTPETEEFRSLSGVPKSDREQPAEDKFAGKVLTTDQLLKLTDAEYEKYLAGE